MNEEVRHFSLRKLSVGLASVLVGISIFGASQTVKADTVTDQTASAVTNNAQSSDTQKNKNVAESSFSNDNRVDNAKSKTTQTQENEPKQVQAENVQHDSAPKTQETTDNKDLGAEKGIVHTSPLQKPDNQSNTVTGKTVQHNALESGQKTQSFNLPKNSQKLAKKVLATNLIETTSSPTTNGGFDEATWGKLDVNNWQGSAQDGVYQLTGYTGDLSHVIVPNEADFEKAGKSTNGLQVGITRDTAHSLLSRNQTQTIAFSKTNNQKVKAIGTDWSTAFAFTPTLSKFDGSNLDVSGVTNMERMFMRDSISDLTSLTNWDTSSVTDMSGMFFNNSISDLRPLINWKTSNVTDMSEMFGCFAHDVIFDESAASDGGNSISDLAPLTKWDVSNVTDMRGMFKDNKISNLTGLANWNIGKVTNMTGMFVDNSISDLTPLAHWNTSGVTDMQAMFADNKISDLSPLANWKTSSVTNMSGMFSNSKRKFMPDGSVVFIDGNSISDLAPLTNWDVGNVTDMSRMFAVNKISNLTGLKNWNVSNVTDMSEMFAGNKISDLTGLKNWNVSNVTDMSEMFAGNKISNLTGLANWKTGNVTDMGEMFAGNPDLIDLKSIANWNISDINDYYGSGFSGLFRGDTKLDLTNINNTPLMQNFLKKPRTLRSTTFITNNADLVKKLVDQEGMLVDQEGQELPIFTKTAKRTIVFHFPDGTQKEIDQIINFKTFAPVQIEWSAPTFVPKSLIAVISPVMKPSSYDPVRVFIPRIIKKYTIDDVKASDWQLDTSQTKPEDVNVVNGRVYFKSVPIPYFKGYKARIVKNPINHMKLMVSFMAVPTENKPSTPVEVTPSKPSAPVDNPSKPSAPVDNPNKPADDLQKHVAAKLNLNDLGWTMPTDVSNSTYTVEVPANDAIIDLSDLVIAEPVHAQTRTQIHVNKRFKLSKKHSIKYLKHRKRVSKLFSKHYALL